jgi:hypothetical protein
MAVADVMRLGWKYMPDRATITYRRQTAPGVYSSETVRDCWRRSSGIRGEFVGVSEAENSAGVYRSQNCEWYIPRARRSTQPVPGDIIRFAAVSNTASPYYGLEGDYIILPTGVDEHGALGAWRCVTGFPFLASGLTDTITIYRPTLVPGGGGRAEEYGRTAVASGISAKIQNEPPNTATDVLGKRQIPTSSVVYLSSQVDVQPHDYLIDQNGLQWSILEERHTAMLGLLQSLSIERVQ